jgi:branched-chain amino acid transport system ATP-binding protein
VREFYLGVSIQAQEPARRQALQASQKVVVVTSLLTVENLSKRFGGLQAVADVSLAVTSGEICSVIGPNGAGKTTLFNMISGVLRPSAGRILFDGIDLASVSPSRFAAIGIGRTFQNLALFNTAPWSRTS